jgi:hypothetical protein
VAKLSPGGGGNVTITPKKTNVRQGARILLTGNAETAETVAISGRSRRRWRSIVSGIEVVDGGFRVALRARRSGRIWFRATAPGLGDSDPIRVRVKARLR